jgi:signal peptidase
VIVWLLPALGLVFLAAYHRRAELRRVATGVVVRARASTGSTAASTPRRPRLSMSTIAWAAAGATTALLLALFAPYAVGGSSFTVMSGSMTPAIRTGDVVVESRLPARDAQVGDVITFRDPGGSHRLITHRVRRLRIGANGTVSLVTKGDNANSVQRWSVPGDGSIGLVRFRIPFLGYALWGTRQPLGRLLLVIVPALLLAATELRGLWRRPGPSASDPSTERPGAAPL